MRKINLVVLVFVVAFILRLVLIFPQYAGDVKNHLAWANGFLSTPIGFYSHHFPGFNDPNYPPVTIFLFSLSVVHWQAMSFLASILNAHFPLFPSFLVPFLASENTQMALLKIPSVLSDLGIGFLLYKIFRKRGENHPLLITSLYLFNPAVLYISSVWGQIESITIFFLLLSLSVIVSSSQKYKYLSIFIFVLAALTKQTALWFTPLYLFLWFKELKIKETLVGSGMGIGLFILSYLPFGLNPLAAALNYLSTLSGSSDYVSDAAYNLWWFFFPAHTHDSFQVGLFTIRQISIFFLFLSLTSLFIYLSKKYSQARFFNALFLWALAVFFLQTRVHERHLAPAIVFLLLTPGLSSRFFIDYFLLSGYHMSNLYSSLRLPFI